MSVKIDPIGTVKPKVSHRFIEKTLAEVAEKISLMNEAALFRFELKTDFKNLGGGKVSLTELILVLKMEMPVWANYSSRPSIERDEWDRFYKALRFHEDEHHNICKREARISYSRLKQANKKSELERIRKSETKRIENLNKQFDVNVGHGMKQKSSYGTTIIDIL